MQNDRNYVLCARGGKRNPWNEKEGNLSVPAALEAERTSHRVRELWVLLGSQTGEQEGLGAGVMPTSLFPVPGATSLALGAWPLPGHPAGADPAKAFRFQDG